MKTYGYIRVSECRPEQKQTAHRYE